MSKNGQAFGVSLKDRAAITLAGHAGKAFWFDKNNGGFVTSPIIIIQTTLNGFKNGIKFINQKNLTGIKSPYNRHIKMQIKRSFIMFLKILVKHFLTM